MPVLLNIMAGPSQRNSKYSEDLKLLELIKRELKHPEAVIGKEPSTNGGSKWYGHVLSDCLCNLPKIVILHIFPLLQKFTNFSLIQTFLWFLVKPKRFAASTVMASFRKFSSQMLCKLVKIIAILICMTRSKCYLPIWRILCPQTALPRHPRFLYFQM